MCGYLPTRSPSRSTANDAPSCLRSRSASRVTAVSTSSFEAHSAGPYGRSWIVATGRDSCVLATRVWERIRCSALLTPCQFCGRPSTKCLISNLSSSLAIRSASSADTSTSPVPAGRSTVPSMAIMNKCVPLCALRCRLCADARNASRRATSEVGP